MQGAWVYDPTYVPRQSIPERARYLLRDRLENHVEAHWSKQCREVVLRFREPYAYVDVIPTKRWLPPDLTPEQRRLAEKEPLHLCRLGYRKGRETWAFAFDKYSNNRYEPNILPNGEFDGTPEDCFDCAAMVYLTF